MGKDQRYHRYGGSATVLTLSTPEEERRTKNEVFVSTEGLSSFHSQWRLTTHLGFLTRYMSILQTVAIATNNRKDNHFFYFSHI